MKRFRLRTMGVGVVVTAILFCVCSLSVRSEEKADEVRELNLTLKALRQQNLSLQRQLQEALFKVEALNLKTSPGSPFSEKRSGNIRNLPDSPEELKWQMMSTVRLLRKTERAREELEQRLRKLMLVAEQAIKSASDIDPKKRALFETESRSIRDLLGPAHVSASADRTSASNVDPSRLKEAKVIEVRKDLSLVLLDVGSKSGVKIGMPFEITRSGKIVAMVIIVEVRENVSGALIDRMEEENPV